MNKEQQLIDALIASKSPIDIGTYESSEEIAIDIALISFENRLSVEELKKILLDIEGAQASWKAAERGNNLAGIAALALQIYAQFISPPLPQPNPQMQQEQMRQAVEHAVENDPACSAYRVPTNQEISIYFERYEMRKDGKLSRHPLPKKKPPYS